MAGPVPVKVIADPAWYLPRTFTQFSWLIPTDAEGGVAGGFDGGFDGGFEGGLLAHPEFEQPESAHEAAP